MTPTIVQTAAGAAALTKSVPTVTYGTYVLVAILFTIVGGFLKVGRDIARARPAMRKLANEQDAGFRDDLLDRIDKLEAKLDEERVRCDADLAFVRHRMNNFSNCLDAILLLIEATPERASEHVARVREMRARQEVAEAAEKTGIHVAKIGAKSARRPNRSVS